MGRDESLLEEILRRGGLLSKVVEGYEPRPQQLEMGRRVLEVLLRERILIAEAPTGVGKTMAYLVPAAIYARRQRETVVISSYTRTLQDQILRLEAPRLRRLIHPDLNLMVLKGSSNYLCRRRWELFLREEGSGPDGRWAVDRLQEWVYGTDTGAFSEAPDLGRRAGWVLARIGGDAHFCRGQLCRADTGCYHKKARREARRADLVVVNHSLLLADALGAGILPEHRALIVDEAHLLPEAALEPLSLRISEKRFEEKVRQMGGSGDPGVSDRMRRVLRRLPSKVIAKNLTPEVREFEGIAREALAQTRAFFLALRSGGSFPPEGERRRYDMRDCTGELLPQETDLFLRAVEGLIEKGRELLGRLQGELPLTDPYQELHSVLEACGGMLDELEEMIKTLQELISPRGHDRVHVLESSRTQGALLSAVPLDTGPLLREHLLLPHGSVTLTSATLAAGDDFSYFARKLGLERGEPEILKLESPFKMREQFLLLLPTYAVDPRDEGYEAFLSGTIAQLAAAVGGKMLVLFTSYKTLQKVYAELAESAELSGVEILAQSREAPRSKLISQFRKAQRSVLLGTSAFWYGVDFPGRELELLVVTRLPFPVPTDPRVQAISEELEQEGRSSFQDYALPEAVLRLRQGVGRLIRRRDDRGVCVILDPRIARARYGEIFCRALPSPPVLVEAPGDLIKRTRAWLAGRA